LKVALTFGSKASSCSQVMKFDELMEPHNKATRNLLFYANNLSYSKNMKFLGYIEKRQW